MVGALVGVGGALVRAILRCLSVSISKAVASKLDIKVKFVLFNKPTTKCWENDPNNHADTSQTLLTLLPTLSYQR